MITFRQHRAAKKFRDVINGEENINSGELLKSVGYGKGYEISPKRVFSSQGFKLALKELGFSIEAADATIAKILRTGKEENQIKASQEIYKRLGAYKQEGSGGNTNILIIPSDVIQRHNVKTNDTDINTVPETNSSGQAQV